MGNHSLAAETDDDVRNVECVVDAVHGFHAYADDKDIAMVLFDDLQVLQSDTLRALVKALKDSYETRNGRVN
jgi:hypothetical protein